MSQIETNIISYGEYGKCVEIKNRNVDLIATIDKGPRIIRFGFINKENEFCEGASFSQNVGSDEWRLMGGHRLWHSPEEFPRTYCPDNEEVQWQRTDNGIKMIQKIEPWVQVVKEMEICLHGSLNMVNIKHRITNKNAWPIKLSAWAISSMAPGGIEAIPQPHRDTGMAVNRIIALWPWTKMEDRRVHWGDKYIVLKHDPDMKLPIKFGIANEEGWAVYFNHGNMFIKRYKHMTGCEYPDAGVSYETFANDFMLEMETLSPFVTLNPNDTVVHEEQWELTGGVDMPSSNEQIIEKAICRYIKRD